MRINIKDEIDLKKIVESGQCFRPSQLEDDLFRFITGREVLYIRDLGGGDFELSCDEDVYRDIWLSYFDLNTNYSKLRRAIPKDDTFMVNAGKLGKGIRILNQDPFEMLLSFIISQRKNIPAIRSCVEKICDIYGEKVDTERETVSLFPTPKNFLEKGLDNLCECSLGYRLPYITEAAMGVADGSIDLEGARNLSDDELLSFLMSIKGVGIKVASCVALFAYGRGGIAPVDTWINRVIDEHYGGVSPFPAYGENSGIYQQYAFFAMIS